MYIDPNIFEALMLICFGAAWPFSIYRMLKTKKSNGKSVPFLVVLLVGYLCGILYEFFGDRDVVTILYVTNIILVSFDLALTLKYRAASTCC